MPPRIQPKTKIELIALPDLPKGQTCFIESDVIEFLGKELKKDPVKIREMIAMREYIPVTIFYLNQEVVAKSNGRLILLRFGKNKNVNDAGSYFNPGNVVAVNMEASKTVAIRRL